MERFLLLFPSFRVQRTDFLSGMYSLVRPYGYADVANEGQLQVLLHGDKNLPDELNGSILELTMRFIHSTCRFQCSIVDKPQIILLTII